METSTPARVQSLDALRGLVMTLMLAEVLHLQGLTHVYPESAFWSMVAFHTSHVHWQGCSLHDLIQPGFSFLAGAAIPFSIASRRARGQRLNAMIGHAAWRAIVLITLGILLRSIGRQRTNFTFEDTLTQIGLGYVFLFALGWAPVRVQAAALAAILAGYWAWFAMYPAPPPGFDYSSVGVPADWPHHYQGFASHWNKNSNAAWAFDIWFLNLFPREQAFRFNGGGYTTLSFIPTLGTMILGLLSGEWLASRRSVQKKLLGLIVAGLTLIAFASIWQVTGAGPIVKRIWTPSFTLYSGGWVLLILAVFYAAMEWKGWRGWAFPLLVVGMNSIAAYLLSWTTERFFLDAAQRHLGSIIALAPAPEQQALLRGAVVMMIFWGILWWMYRRRIFLRI